MKVKTDIKARKNLMKFLFIVYILFMINVLFLSVYWGRGVTPTRNINLIPFKTIKMYFNFGNNSLDFRSFMVNILGNILVFLPLGFLYTSLVKRKIKFFRIFKLAIIIPIIIESIQYFLSVGSFDIDDIILNFIGIILGYYVFKLFYQS